ncbi:MAG: ABC transporter ATP-binding protein [Spirochaetota bacterium]|nr:ABC transporter ATP-binding protein [Spirochaetota bacterium]
MIEIRDLSLTRNKTEILQNINLSFNEGDVIGIIGEAGAGKTALLQILAGVIKDYKGDVIIKNNNLLSLTKGHHQLLISSLLNSIPSNDEYTLYDSLLEARKPFKKFLNPLTELDLQLTEEYLNLFELDRFKEKKICTLSDGIIKRTLLASSFIRDAATLIIDNPTCDLDIRSISLLQKAISKYVIDGDKILIIASNDINFIIQTVDRIIILQDGHLVLETRPDAIDGELIKRYFNLEVIFSRNMYNGKPDIQLFPVN